MKHLTGYQVCLAIGCLAMVYGIYAAIESVLWWRAFRKKYRRLFR